MAVKNLHLEHLEDEIINNGIDGGRASITFLLALRDMMKGNAKKKFNMTVKWDGAPAIFCGKHPEDGRFFVAKKSLFNKEPKFYCSVSEIKNASELSGDLEKKFIDSFEYLSKLSWNKVMQGDLMFTQADKKMKKINDIEHITFQPNTIMYAVPVQSELGKQIANAKYGIVFHTTYEGSSIDDLGASFGADISSLGHNNDVWIDDATFKNVAGNSTLTGKETLKLSTLLTKTGKSFHKIKRPSLIKFMKIQDTIASKGAGATYKTYMNAQIRKGKFNLNYNDYLKHFENYWKTKVVGAVKMQKTKDIKEQIGKDLVRDIRSLKPFITALTEFQVGMVEAKQIIIDGLNKAKSIGTFVRTPTGLKVVNPEGYVAIDDDGKAVKLVDRMEFSLNNFTAAKAWDK
jgi:hypothetical protein|tara:strand:+ start:1103 stop:2308 length:1206 start_codon:yes stop_codon:yes gene_type:complete